MCGIAGFYNPHRNYLEEEARYRDILKDMAAVQRHRGPDDSGVCLSRHTGLSHARLSIIDLVSGHQPMEKEAGGRTYSIAYNGELYNTEELRTELRAQGHSFATTSDTEVILTGCIEYGPDFVKRLNGIFAIAFYDALHDRVILFRDRAGVKPLFYTVRGDEILFASELKGILAVPGIRPELDRKGLNEVFSIGPARTYGCGVFAGMEEVLPGHFLICSPEGVSSHCYWKLVSLPHEDSYEKTIEKTAFLVQDSIKRQMVSDVPICTFLSGGVDSSLVSAVCAAELKKQGKKLTTFSFDFVNNDKYFKANSFQPSQDRPFVDRMVEFLDSDHHYLECGNTDQADRLCDSVLAHDLPAMGDIDSSMLHFCSLVKEHNKVALTGECADEIFGGYPWFHKEECFRAHTFPWTMDLEARKVLLKDDFLDYLQMDEYVKETYERSVAETPTLSEDSPTEARRREIAYLNLHADSFKPHGPRQHVFQPGSQGAVCRPPDHGVRLECPLGHEDEGRPGQKPSASVRERPSARRYPVPQEIALSEDLRHELRKTPHQPCPRNHERFVLACHAVSGQKKTGDVSSKSLRLRKTMVRPADGRSADAGLYTSD